MECKPLVVLWDMDGPEGNTIAVLAACERAARKAGWPQRTIELFKREALSLNRQHFMDMVFECFQPLMASTTLHQVGRESIQ